MTQKICIYCGAKYDPDPLSEYQVKFEGCPSCEKATERHIENLTRDILSVPVEIRRQLWDEIMEGER